jgi:Domain of unknown function (DUF5615)
MGPAESGISRREEASDRGVTVGILFDENLPHWWRVTLNLRQPGMCVWQIGDPATPPLGAKDPAVIAWCEAHDFWFLTNNRSTMPQHLADHVANGGHVRGIFIVDPAMDIDLVEEQLLLIEGATIPGEFQDQIQYLPLA